MSVFVALTSFDITLLVVGIVTLYLGAGVLAEGVSRFAIGLGLRAATVGVIIIAFVTATPELSIAVLNGLDYNFDLGLGAIAGLNIASIGFVLGISAFIKPMGVSTATLRRHAPFMITAAVALVALGMDGNLSAVDGGILLLIPVTFMGYLLYRARSTMVGAIGADEIDIEDEDEASAQFRDVVYLALDLFLLFVGSDWLIQGG